MFTIINKQLVSLFLSLSLHAILSMTLCAPVLSWKAVVTLNQVLTSAWYYINLQHHAVRYYLTALCRYRYRSICREPVVNKIGSHFQVLKLGHWHMCEGWGHGSSSKRKKDFVPKQSHSIFLLMLSCLIYFLFVKVFTSV